ncbi:MAG: hypothetical protein AB7O92_31800 [Acidimicrobiia bacterium]
MAMPASDELIHLFSYETGVSFELPLGWEQRHEAAGLAEYGLDPDDDDEQDDDDGALELDADARFTVMAVGETASPDGFLELAGELARAAGLTITSERDQQVDDADVHITVGRALPTDRAAGGEQLVVQAVAQRGASLWVLRGSAPVATADRHRRLFDAAIASARFIQLDGGRS